MLVGQGRRVRTLVRGRSGDREFTGVDVERTVGDVTDPESVRQAVAGARVVIHSAAMVHVGWRRLAEMRRVNVEGTRVFMNRILITAPRADSPGARLVPLVGEIPEIDGMRLEPIRAQLDVDGGGAGEKASLAEVTLPVEKETSARTFPLLDPTVRVAGHTPEASVCPVPAM
jgi:hypothetical protein